MQRPKGVKTCLLLGSSVALALGVATWISWPQLRFWWRFKPLGKNAQGYPEYRHRQTGIVMVKLPGGTFLMGAQKDDPNAPNYDPKATPAVSPVHEVTLSPFLISKYEVTQAQWRAIIGNNPSQFSRTGQYSYRLPEGVNADDLPVENLSWNDGQEFCRKTGLRLPTEAQWEYACRAGSTARFFFGDSEELLGDYCWHHLNCPGIPQPVGLKKPNAFGLHDTYGNVYEMCEDTFQTGFFYSQPEAAGPDPVCTTDGETRALRGGCAADYPSERVRWSAGRGLSTPDEAFDYLGFRPVYWPIE